MKFSPDFIERVSTANNIVDIISQYTQLKPSGGGMMGRCPFPDHPEKTASFSVSEAKQVYHCFGCKKSGNIFSFLQTYNGMSFPDAVEYLANRAHIPMPVAQNREESEQQDKMVQKKKQLLKVNQLAAEYFHQQFRSLAANHPAKAYAHQRGLTQEMIEEFKIGYSTEEWDGLIHFLQSRNVPLPLAEEARLIKARSGGKTGYFDLFRERLMFPIFSTMGDPIAFGGRILAQGEPKYLNSPETPVFHKGRVLYGLAQTAKYIRSEDQVIVVEGYMDLVSLYQAGFKNVVATMGTALTSDHGKMLSRITKNVVVLFDGDSAGQDAAERSLPLLLAAGLYPKGLILPDDLDPDDFVKEQGAEKLREMIATAQDLFPMILTLWMKGYRGEASEKVKLATRLQSVFMSIQDLRLKQLYLAEAAARMNVEERWLRGAIGQKPSTENNFRGSSPAANDVRKQNLVQEKSVSLTEEKLDQIQLKGASVAEATLLGLVLKSPENFSQFLESGVQESVLHSGVREVLTKATEVYRQAPEKFDKLSSLLASYVDRPDMLIAKDFFAQAGSEDVDEADTEREQKLLQDCLKKVRESFIKAQVQKLTLELKGKADPEKLQQLMELQREVLTLRNQSTK
jgi:DNA primase